MFGWGVVALLAFYYHHRYHLLLLLFNDGDDAPVVVWIRRSLDSKFDGPERDSERLITKPHKAPAPQLCTIYTT